VLIGLHLALAKPSILRWRVQFEWVQLLTQVLTQYSMQLQAQLQSAMALTKSVVLMVSPSLWVLKSR
jgi:hypothetical protein